MKFVGIQKKFPRAMCSNNQTLMKEIKGLSNEVATPPSEITRSNAIMIHPQHTSDHLTHSSSMSV